MSNQGQGASGASGGSNQNQECDCGYDPTNKKHEESYWEGRTDPRFHPDCDDRMKYNSHYYNVIDRQIAADHATECIPQQQSGSSGAGGQKKN